jgi:mono/diheme cytochrome c family protein
LLRTVSFNSRSQRTWLPLATALLVVVGGCTAAIDPTPPDQTTQEKKTGLTPKLGNEETEPHQASVKEERPHDIVAQVETNEAVARGGNVYREQCSNCHGVDGDGQGKVAQDLSTKPLDFTKGVYKFRSTPSGDLPTDDDLFRTISEGIPGTAMDSYKGLPKTDLRALVMYLKTLSPRFLKRSPGTPIVFPPAHLPTQKAVTRGLQVYRQMQCSACHGDEARGNGPLAQELTDPTGQPSRPADLTAESLKSGQGPQAIYRTIMTGLDGTPMPSYGDSLDPEEGWDLALYIFSLAHSKDTH